MKLEDISEEVCRFLILSSYDDEANEIKDQMKKVLLLDRNDSTRSLAIENLMSRCHPKWLGDYYINNVTYKEWIDLITD